MKTKKYILLVVLILATCFACTNNEWDNHYSLNSQEVNSTLVVVVESSLIDYLKSESSLSAMCQLFEESGVISEMKARDQLFTVLAVGNNSINNSEGVYTDDKEYLAKTHISDIALSPANLSDVQRVLMWNNKYLSITKEANANNEYTFYFNGTKVVRIIKASDGYIYELESYANSPMSMYEIIEGLSDDYSIFREMILSRNEKTFDKSASRPIGVDKTGSTVYDSVFIVTNPYFTAQNFDLTSESLTATMLIPSDEIVTEALTTAKNNLTKWRLTRADSILNNWIFQSAFFSKQYSKQDFENNQDLTTVFSKQWRTTVQEVYLDNPITMSNGVAYYVKSMKIPTNVLIYRLKDYMKWYEYMTDTDKEKYFYSDNLKEGTMSTPVTAWSGWPGVFPTITNVIVTFNMLQDIGEYNMDFVPFQYTSFGDGTYNAVPYLIPPGEYDLCLGFAQNMAGDVDVSFNSNYIGTVTTSLLSGTTFHYDRGGQGYPEGYDTAKATDSKKGNYDRDGGRVGGVTISGTEAVEVMIRYRGVGVKSGGKLVLHHWCLKPTKNCY